MTTPAMFLCDAFDALCQKSPIHQPNDQDVLCGKDRSLTSHTGNIAFRDVIESYKSQYMNATTKREKMRITKEVVDTTKSKCNARFLKLQGREWKEISDQAARDKVSHALRFASRQNTNTIPCHMSLPNAVSVSSTSSDTPIDDALFCRQQELLSYQMQLEAPRTMDCNDSNGDTEPQSSIDTSQQLQQDNEEEDAFDSLRSEELEFLLSCLETSESEWSVVKTLAES